MTTQPAVPVTPDSKQNTPTEPDVEVYNSFVAVLQLTGIEVVKVQGERIAPGTAAQTRFDLTAGYMVNEDALQYRFDVTAHFLDDSGTTVGNSFVSVILAARCAPATDVACIERFGATSAALMVHPYLREAIASTAQRIGFPGVLLPMIKYHPKTLSDN